MTYVLALSVLSNVALAGAFLAYVLKRDEREQRERTQLLQRIQAPEVAVAQAIEIPDQPVLQHAMSDEAIERYMDEISG